MVIRLTVVFYPSSSCSVFSWFDIYARSTCPFSCTDLKTLKSELKSPLTRLFNYSFANASFPAQWLESSLTFIHKKGSLSDPNNYRVINVNNALYKVYMSVVTNRLSIYAESNNLLPALQFGFRKGRSTYGAAALLHEVIYSRLQNKLRTYICYIDFKKFFDFINRNLLLTKLQRLGIPVQYCKVFCDAWSGMKCFLKDSEKFSCSFTPTIGTSQGCVSAAILASFFISDLPDCLLPVCPVISSNYRVSGIFFADDLALLATTQKICNVNLMYFMHIVK